MELAKLKSLVWFFHQYFCYYASYKQMEGDEEDLELLRSFLHLNEPARRIRAGQANESVEPAFSLLELKKQCAYPARIQPCDVDSPDPQFLLRLYESPCCVCNADFYLGYDANAAPHFFSQKSGRRVQVFKNNDRLFYFGQVWDGFSLLHPLYEMYRGQLSAELQTALGTQDLYARLRWLDREL